MDIIDESLYKNADNKLDLLDNISDSEYNIINVGNDRVIIEITKDTVAKIEIKPRQNKREIKCYQNNEYRPYLCPIIDYTDDKKCIAFKRVIFNVSYKEKREFLYNFIEETNSVPVDFRLKEVGRYENNIVFTDYGFGFDSIDSSLDTEQIIKNITD